MTYEQLIRWENDLSAYEQDSVAATFIAQLERLNTTSRDVNNLLKLISFFDPESIDVDIFVKGAEALRSEHLPPSSPEMSTPPPARRPRLVPEFIWNRKQRS